ncbi:hypothetical protein niasHT_014247 [Heterodera trifolii]|uniref:Uncharacterized protein n=1 Tax=Heterodera trifolii TaxID=157864 RepID=A0ABD2KY72_9BILA
MSNRGKAKSVQVGPNPGMSNRGKAKSVQIETNAQLKEKNKVESVHVGPNPKLIERSEAKPVQTGTNPQLTESSKAKSVQRVTNPEMQNKNETNSVQTGSNLEFPERSKAKSIQMEKNPQLTDGSEGNSISQNPQNFRSFENERNIDKRKFLESKKENLRLADSSRDYGPRHRQFHGHDISPNRPQRHHDNYHTHSTRHGPEISPSRSQRYHDHYHTHSTRPSYRRNSSPDRQSAVQQGSQHSENYSTTEADRNRRGSSQQRHQQHYSHPSSSKSQRHYSSPDQKRASSSADSRRTNNSSSLDQYINCQSAQAQIIRDQTAEHNPKETNRQKQKQPVYEQNFENELYDPLQPSSLTTNAQAYNQPEQLQTTHASHGQPMFLPMNYHQPLLQAQAVNVSSQPAVVPFHAYPLQNPTHQTNFIYQQVQPMIVQPQPGPVVITQITPQPILPQYMPISQGPSTQYQSNDQLQHHVITINTNSGTNNYEKQNQREYFEHYPSKYSEREPASQHLAEKKNSDFRQLPINKTFNRWALPIQYNNTQQLDCYRIVTGDTVYIANMAKNRIRKTHPIDPMLDMSCDAIRSRNYFLLDQTEDSEDDFPFAQAKTIYKDYFLLEMELAATYSPKNWYCYVLDTKSDRLFKRQMRALAKCFPNILIGTERKLNNDGQGMAEAYLDCLTMLAKPHRQWKYVSLLQNHDTAIKTRFQIMQILKWLDGANDAEITNPGRRINRKLDWTVSALSLFHNKTKMAAFGSKKIAMTKGNVAATLSRHMVEYVLNELDLTEMLRRLNQVEFGRDEYLFPTLNSVDFIGAPGGASQICIEKRQQVEQFTRAVVWINYSADECASRFKRHGVCVFGMEDLGTNFIRWPHIYANKFVPEFDLGASVCWYEALYNRTQFNSREEQLAMLDKEFYLQLPNVG